MVNNFELTDVGSVIGDGGSRGGPGRLLVPRRGKLLARRGNAGRRRGSLRRRRGRRGRRRGHAHPLVQGLQLLLAPGRIGRRRGQRRQKQGGVGGLDLDGMLWQRRRWRRGLRRRHGDRQQRLVRRRGRRGGRHQEGGGAGARGQRQRLRQRPRGGDGDGVVARGPPVREGGLAQEQEVIDVGLVVEPRLGRGEQPHGLVLFPGHLWLLW